MIKLTYCVRRLPHLTREQFLDYWLNRHGPLVKSHAQVLNIRRYVQVHATGHPANEAMRASRSAPEPFDGIAELWFDSVATMTAPSATPEGRSALRALREDEARFIDQARSPLWFGEEHTVVG
jgi:uncharacterized protein (TIGR02118 family)